MTSIYMWNMTIGKNTFWLCGAMGFMALLAGNMKDD